MRRGEPVSVWAVLAHPAVFTLGVLAVVAVAYGVTYVSAPMTPGTFVGSWGWWGWYDQSLYLKAARAWAGFDFRPEMHAYPPLYPMLGSLFVGDNPSRLYYGVNLVLLCGFVLACMMCLRRHIGVRWAGAAAVLGVLTPGIIAIQWVIPWTSTLAALLMALGFLLFDRYLVRRSAANFGAVEAGVLAVLFGAAIGLLAPTRPGEVLTMAPVALAYAGFALFGVLQRQAITKVDVATVTGGLLGFATPVLLYVAFNMAVYGAMGGQYYDQINDQSGGFWFVDFGEKFFSHVFASHVFYGEHGATWLNRMPLYAFALMFLPATLLFAPWTLRVFAMALTVHLFVVFSFADALPTGTFRFFNIHYFKWCFPLLLGMVIWWGQAAWRGATPRARPAFVASLALFVIGSSITARYAVAPAAFEGDLSDRATVRFAAPTRVDFVDVDGLEGGWSDRYFDRGTRVMLDGGPGLRPIRDFRVLAIGEQTRILFIKPVTAQRIDLVWAEELRPTAPEDVAMQAVRVGFTPGLPWRQHAAPPIAP